MKTFLLIAQLLPAIVAAIKQAEELVPVSGAGKAKLDFVLGLLQDTVDDLPALGGVIDKVVARVVTLANVGGTFQKAAVK